MQELTVMIRCDGSSTLGFGHVVRCIALADEFRDTHAAQVCFAIQEGALAVERVQAAGYTVFEPTGADNWLNAALDACGADVLIVDARERVSRRELETARKRGVTIAVLDDGGERCLAADLAFFPPAPQFAPADQAGNSARCYAGWEWVLLRPQFANVQRQTRATTRVLVTMGGSDPFGLTLRSLQAIDTIDGEFEVVVVLGPAYERAGQIRGWCENARREYHIVSDVQGMSALMGACDIAVASFGVTAYELAASGVPAVYLSISADHARGAQMFQDAGMAISLGEYSKVRDADLIGALEHLLRNSVARARMAKCGRERVDGQGARRIAQEIVEHVGASHTKVAGRG